MPQSLANVVVHLVFSTKNRIPSLTPEIRSELFPYLGGVLRNHGCNSIQVGGVEDHLHILVGISRTLTVAQTVEKVKTSTSKWLKSRGIDDFAWQGGYAAFSVGSQEVDQTIAYIQNQEPHHKQVSFQDEFRRLLHEHRIDFDERYVWE